MTLIHEQTISNNMICIRTEHEHYGLSSYATLGIKKKGCGACLPLDNGLRISLLGLGQVCGISEQ